MDRAKRTALIAIPVALAAGAGLAWAGSSGNLLTGVQSVFTRAVILAFAVQWIAFVPAFIFRTEHFYDMVGSLTYISVVAFAVLLVNRTDQRALLLFAMVTIWALRLGLFLSHRVRRAGKDDRFTEIKKSFIRFLSAWTLQGLWVSFTLAAALAAITAPTPQPLGLYARIGLAVWVLGFGFEIVADWQKSRFRRLEANRGKFISSGLWAWSRHANYFGEIVLWVGVLIVAAPVLQGWQWVALASPVFVTLLLTKISGIPLLERRADEKWGGQEDYEAYKKRTSILVPWPPKK